MANIQSVFIKLHYCIRYNVLEFGNPTTFLLFMHARARATVSGPIKNSQWLTILLFVTV